MIIHQHPQSHRLLLVIQDKLDSYSRLHFSLIVWLQLKNDDTAISPARGGSDCYIASRKWHSSVGKYARTYTAPNLFLFSSTTAIGEAVIFGT
jgi:hypothetical protein